MTALVKEAIPEMLFDIGPRADPTASKPRSVFRALAYGKRCNVGLRPKNPQYAAVYYT